MSPCFDLPHMFEDFAHSSWVYDHRNEASSAPAGASMGIDLEHFGDEPGPIGFSLSQGR